MPDVRAYVPVALDRQQDVPDVQEESASDGNDADDRQGAVMSKKAREPRKARELLSPTEVQEGAAGRKESRSLAIRRYYTAVRAKDRAAIWERAVEAREMIDPGELIAGIMLHFRGDLELTDTQLAAGFKLLNKVVPDLSSATIDMHQSGGPIQIQLIPVD